MSDLDAPDIVLRFRPSGPAYERAAAVATAMGLPIEDYLIRCIAEGHRLLRDRYAPDPTAELDEPAFIRRGVALG